ncbi:unnamed protein product [Closterium sp. NIES-54]
MHADLENRWDIATMMVKEALASWKGKAVKAGMDEEIRSLIGMGTLGAGRTPTWGEHYKEPVGPDDQVYGADYDKTYAPVSSYIMLTIFLSIVAILDLNLMQLDMKNAFRQSKLDKVLYMYQVDYYDDGTGRVDDLLAASSSTAMLRELKELLEAAFELREISLVVKYLRLEIVRDRPVRKLWLHQQSYVDNLRRRFIDEEETGRVPKTPVTIDACAELTFDDEEEYWQKVGSLQFAAITTRPDIALPAASWGAASRLVVEQSFQSWSAEWTPTMPTTSRNGRAQAAMCLSSEGLPSPGRASASSVRRSHRPTAGRWDVDRPSGKKKSAISVAKGLGMQGNLKHMEPKYAWPQHMVKRRKFTLKYILTTEQPPEFLTKALHFLACNQCSIAIDDGDDDMHQ